MKFPTRYGHLIDFDNPNVGAIDIKDIVNSLSHICRFNGHSKHHYSVAQHSVLVASAFVKPDEKLYALIHDAHEAYTGDLTSPFKSYLETKSPNIIRNVENRLDGAIHKYFELEYPVPIEIKEKVKHADRKALATEARDLTKTRHKDHIMTLQKLPEPFPERIEPLSHKQAHKLLMAELKTTEAELLASRIASRPKTFRGQMMLPGFEK